MTLSLTRYVSRAAGGPAPSGGESSYPAPHGSHRQGYSRATGIQPREVVFGAYENLRRG